MKLFLDDMHPCPEGWVLAKTADEAIRHLATGECTHVSLDHDLAWVQYNNQATEESRRPDWEEKTGYTVALWIEEQAIKGKLPPLICRCHSANPVGKRRIEQALFQAQLAWKKNDSDKPPERPR